MKRDDFFRGLFAALRLCDQKFIITRTDAHHEAFQRVVDLLEESPPLGADLPDPFVPSPFTGRFRELDNALVRFQHGLLGAQNPFYPYVNLDISAARAKQILAGFSDTQQQLFLRLANAFLDQRTQVVAGS